MSCFLTREEEARIPAVEVYFDRCEKGMCRLSARELFKGEEYGIIQRASVFAESKFGESLNGGSKTVWNTYFRDAGKFASLCRQFKQLTSD